MIELLNKKDKDGAELWGLQKILDHRWSKEKERKGRQDVLVLWDTGEKSWEPLEIIKKDDPVTVANYREERGLLKKPLWKWAARYSKLDQDD